MHIPSDQRKEKGMSRWFMVQTWEHPLFAHWPVSTEAVRPFVPEQLEIDTFDGQAWLGAIAFYMTGVKLRYVPVPYPFHFPEVNIRTYVKGENGSPAVFFIALDAADPLVVSAAKLWFGLPYYRAKMTYEHKGNRFLIGTRRKNPPAGLNVFRAEYRPLSAPFAPEEGTLAHWLTERYVFFYRPAGRNGKCLSRGEVCHAPWQLQSAEADIPHNTLVQPFGVNDPLDPPILHYSCGVTSRIGPVKKFA